MIPYFPQPEVHRFGPITVHAFGAIGYLSCTVTHDHPDYL
jgi:hypothetical protein